MQKKLEELQLHVQEVDVLRANEKKKQAQLDLAKIIAKRLLDKIQDLAMQLKEKKNLITQLAQIPDIPNLRKQQIELQKLEEELQLTSDQSKRNLEAQQAKLRHAEQVHRDYHAAAGSRDDDDDTEPAFSRYHDTARAAGLP
jgi:uncharacterized protein YPO0396